MLKLVALKLLLLLPLLLLLNIMAGACAVAADGKIRSAWVMYGVDLSRTLGTKIQGVGVGASLTQMHH